MKKQARRPPMVITEPCPEPNPLSAAILKQGLAPSPSPEVPKDHIFPLPFMLLPWFLVGKVKGMVKSWGGIQGILLMQAVSRTGETQEDIDSKKCLTETRAGSAAPEATKKSRDLSKSLWVGKSGSSERERMAHQTGASAETKGKVVGREGQPLASSFWVACSRRVRKGMKAMRSCTHWFSKRTQPLLLVRPLHPLLLPLSAGQSLTQESKWRWGRERKPSQVRGAASFQSSTLPLKQWGHFFLSDQPPKIHLTLGPVLGFLLFFPL